MILFGVWPKLRPRLASLAAIAALALLLCACGGARGRLAPSRHVVLVSIDGMKPEYYLRADALGLKIPALRRLMARGSYAEGVRGTWPTLTYPAHTTLVTGVWPTRHGIGMNMPFDPTGENQDGWYWYATDIRKKTLWDAARERGLTVGNSYWPVTVGANIDWNFPQIWRSKRPEDDKLVRALATPGIADEVLARYGALPTEHRSDRERTDAGEYLLLTRRPALTLVYLTDLDTVQHESGPGSAAAFATLEGVDAQLGRLVRATEVAGDAANTAFVVVSDHGFLPVHTTLRPGVLLRQHGLVDIDDRGRVRRWRAAPWKAGGTCAIVFAEGVDANTRAKVKELFSSLQRDPNSGIAAVRDGADTAAKGGFERAAFVLEATPGYAFAAGFEGNFSGPSGDRGAHGYSPDEPAMRAGLIVAGAGLRAGVALGVVDMRDIAPTIAKLLELSLPDADGRPIAALLE